MTETEQDSNKLISGRLLARNVIWNFVGQASPMLVALVAIPLLIRGLGIDRFGVLTLAWMVIGYFSLFDFGLGRALTKVVAEKLGAKEEHAIPSLVWTSLALMAGLGLLGSIVAIALSPWLVQKVLNIPLNLQSETLMSFYLLAAAIPIVITTAGFRGVFEAHQLFGLTNAIRIAMGILTFLGPLLVLPFTQDLFPIVLVLVIGRVIAWGAHIYISFRVIPVFRNSVTISREMVRQLLGFGGWMTITNIVGPLMVILDRFLIGALISVTAVAYYTTPFEIVTRLFIIPNALVGVFFPAFSLSFVKDRNHVSHLFWRGTKYILLALYPIIILIVIFAPNGLNIWLGSDFAENSTFVLQWLAIGVFINSLAQVPFALIQGAGRPDLTAKIHILELPCYLLVIWNMIKSYGIEGAAMAWTARVSADAVLLFHASKSYLSSNRQTTRKHFLIIGAVFLSFVAGAVLNDIFLKSVFFFFIFVSYVFLAWKYFLDSHEKESIQAVFHATLNLNQ